MASDPTGIRTTRLERISRLHRLPGNGQTFQLHCSPVCCIQELDIVGQAGDGPFGVENLRPRNQRKTDGEFPGDDDGLDQIAERLENRDSKYGKYLKTPKCPNISLNLLVSSLNQPSNLEH